MTSFTHNIIQWYRQNKRDLPWRNSDNPYHIWIAEVILQQTQVIQGIDYYYRFLEAFPNVTALAAASEQEVLKLWQGLGYYSRARNLHFAAKEVVSRFDGVVPNSRVELQKLKGIGPYTSAAVASIAFGERCAVVDGNVYRLLSRFFAIDTPVDTPVGKRLFEELAYDLMVDALPGEFNQALMEMGALVCRPIKPDCSNCPLMNQCMSFRTGDKLAYPVKSKILNKKNRYFNYLVVADEHALLLSHRQKGDIWQGLFDFPVIESSDLLSLKDLKTIISKLWSQQQFIYEINGDVIHLLTHRNIHARFFLMVKSNDQPFPASLDGKNLIIAKFEELHTFPVPKLIENKIKSIFSEKINFII